MYRLLTIVAFSALATVAIASPGSIIPPGDLALDLGAATVTAPAATAPVTSQAVRLVPLDDPRLEFSIVTSVAPTVTGQGGCASYQFAGSDTSGAKAWADLGVMRWESKTDPFAGVSTNIPFGGQTLSDNARIGAGYLFRADTVFGYLRGVISF